MSSGVEGLEKGQGARGTASRYYVYSELDSFVLPERNEPNYT
jgi:hypothetical protein